MTIQQMIYDKIFSQEREGIYKIFEEYWYVVPWLKGSYIHYTIKQSKQVCKIYWYLSGTPLPPKWRCQVNEIKLKSQL